MSTGRMGIRAAVPLVLLGLVGPVGCGQGEALRTPAPWFVGEYVDPSHPDGAIRLKVLPDGTFTLARRGNWEEDDESDVVVASGRWTSEGDGLTLDGDGWGATLISDEISVTLPGRTDTIPGLRCTEAFGSTLMDSVRLMRYRDFADFVHPPQGSGSSTGGL